MRGKRKDPSNSGPPQGGGEENNESTGAKRSNLYNRMEQKSRLQNDHGSQQSKKFKLISTAQSSSSHTGQMSVVQRTQCAKILIALKVRQPQNVVMFLQPVSDLRIIDDYRRKIANPMDLGTMQSKLERNEYQTPSAFVLDLRRIFANCLIYNTLGNPYRQVAVACLETAEQLTSVFLAQPKHQIYTYTPLLFCWKLCLNVLDTLSTVTNPYDGNPTLFYFLFPVALYCGGQFPPDYLAKVAKPMDFGKVTKQLIEGRYATVDQFEADCLLVLNNCTLYYVGREDGAIFTEQAYRLRAVLQEQMSALKKYIKSPLGEALEQAARNAEVTASLLEPPIRLLQDTADAQLEICQSKIQSPEQQELCIRMQANHIKGLDAELKKQQLDNVATKKRIGKLETEVAAKKLKIKNQSRTLESLQNKMRARKLQDAAPNIQQQSLQMPECRLVDMTSMVTTRGNDFGGGEECPSTGDCPSTEIDIPTFAADVDMSKIQSQLQRVARENQTLQKQLNDSIQENGSLKVDLLVKELVHERESLQKQVNDSIQQNGSLRADFRKQEQAIKHQFDVTKTQLTRLRHANKNLERSQFKDNFIIVEHSIATLKGTIRKLKDEMRKGDSEKRAAKAKLNAKLAKTMQDQSKLLAAIQQLQRDKLNIQLTMQKEKEKLREENEELEEEMEQIKMNHAMEIGFLKGSSG